MKTYSWLLLFLALFIENGSFQGAPQSPQKPLPAPTFYIAVESQLWSKNLVRFRGASNLPPRSIVTLDIRDFHEDGWDFYSDPVYAAVDDKGILQGEISPKQGMTFRRNLILVADFMPYQPAQPESVLRIVGTKGEFLGGAENPQRFQVSGWIYGLETMARTL